MNTQKYELLLDLKTLTHLLDKAESHVQEKGIPESALLTSQLAPDMFTFTRQIQIASDGARQNLFLLAGKEHVKIDDTETTIVALRERVKKTEAIINELTATDFANADERHITLEYWPEGTYMDGKDFLVQQAIPNFMFHMTTAYAILRNQGVVIGKKDFITTSNKKTD
jgi:uncharacterized protein